MPASVEVLHVDDEPQFGDLVADFVERKSEQIEVTTKTHPAEALDFLEDAVEEIDCVVSDYDMPGKNGLEFLNAVRDITSDLPFILFTGKGSEEVASDAISAGVTEYMQKEGGTDQYTVLANRIENSVDKYWAQKEAKRTQRRLGELTQSSVDCLWMFNREWDDLHFISGYEDVWHRPVTAIKENPQDFLDGVHSDHRDNVEAAMNRLSNGETIDIEYRILRGDNEPGWVWVKGEPIYNEDDVVRVVGFTRDITDRKQRERALREERDFVDQALNTLDDVFYLIGTDGHLERWNDRLASVTGYDDAQIQDMAAVELFPEDEREKIATAIQNTLTTGEVTVEAEFLTVNGERIPYEFTGARLTNPEGEVIGLVGVGRDLTERRERQRELERTQARFDALTENTDLAIVTIDDQHTIQYANNGVQTVFGYTPDELIGESLLTIMPQRFHERHQHAVKQYLESGEKQVDWNWVELPGLDCDGNEVPLGISFGEAMIDGERRFTAVLRDLSVRS